MTDPGTISTCAQSSVSKAPGFGEEFVRRLRFLAAMVVAGAVFWRFGWWVARPVDPVGAVALLTIDQSVIAMAKLLGLAVVVSGLAVAICGAGSAERGPLAVAVGLACLAFRGGRMDAFVLQRLSEQPTSGAGSAAAAAYPAWGFIAETWLWLALIGMGFVVGRWVEGWFSAERTSRAAARSVDHGADIRQGAGTVAIAFVVALVTILYTAGGAETPLLKGQLYFSLILAFLLASIIAQWFFQTTAKVWSLAVIALVAMVAYYGWQPDGDAIDAGRQAGLYVTLAPPARPLPIEYASLGGIGVLMSSDILSMICVMFGLSPGERSAT